LVVEFTFLKQNVIVKCSCRLQYFIYFIHFISNHWITYNYNYYTHSNLPRWYAIWLHV